MANAERVKQQRQVGAMPGRASTPDFRGEGSREGPCTSSQEEGSV